MAWTRGLAVGAVVAATAIGSAGLASADPLSGSYTATVTGNIGTFSIPNRTWLITPCGPDCVNIDAQGAQLHMGENGTWSGTFELHATDNGETVVCTRIIQPSLAASDICPQPASFARNYQLTKNG